MTRSTIPEKEQVEVPDEAMAAAKRAAGVLLPVCDMCGVEYVEDYRGPCQEPLPPYEDPSKICPGKVDLTPGYMAERALQAAAPVLCAQERERLEAQINEEAADFDAELEDFASALMPGGPRPDYEAIANDLNRIACELSALAPSKLAVHRQQAAQQERERVKEALLSDEAINAVTEVLDSEFAFEAEGEAVTDYALAKLVLTAALTTLVKETD